MTGLNISAGVVPGSNLRFDVPGDSIAITSSGTTARVDMVFRILPGPGNYIAQPGNVLGRPDLPGAALKRRPDQVATITPGDGSFWSEYKASPGPFASPSAAALHAGALGGWDPNVWNSARCDTAEVNLFARQQAGTGNVLGGPPDPALWMSTLHEVGSQVQRRWASSTTAASSGRRPAPPPTSSATASCRPTSRAVRSTRT